MKSIRPSRISGEIEAPPSKSMMQRALIASALAEGESEIENPSYCTDSVATMGVIETLGAQVMRGPDSVIVLGKGEPRGKDLDCGESGTCIRMITPVAALFDHDFSINGKGTLKKRPLGMVEEPLRILGARCSTRGGLTPIKVKGPIHGGKIEIDGSETSQFLSGLLMALPLCDDDSEILVRNLKSRQYVDMTISVLKAFGVAVETDGADRFMIKGRQGYRACRYLVEGDWSGAAFLLVAGAIAGDVTVRNLGSAVQPDRAIVDVLIQAGAKVKSDNGVVHVEQANLKAFEYDANGTPDLFPSLAVLACSCEGRSVIHGVGRLRGKESDRAAALSFELGRIGARIRIEGDSMVVEGSRLYGGHIDPRGDHRIAMAAAIAALTSGGEVEIEKEGCVAKSYPDFFRDLASLIVER
ncbi:MAG: 3-phosphoshikimate 1-carboxyvinyltransferase [Candidatus Micrarchaeota archaeon]